MPGRRSKASKALHGGMSDAVTKAPTLTTAKVSCGRHPEPNLQRVLLFFVGRRRNYAGR